MISPTSKPEVKRIAKKVTRGTGTLPSIGRLRYLITKNSEVSVVTIIAVDKMNFMVNDLY